MKRILSLATLATLALGGTAFAQNVTVSDAWARATSPSQSVGGVFLTLPDTGADDALVSATSPVSATVELHQTVADNGVMKMLPIPSLPLTHGQSVTLKPGSYHLMVMGLKQQLKPGDTFPVTLNFAHGTPVTATVAVGAAGASAPGGMGGMDHMNMDHMNMDHSSMSMPMPSKP